jgi:hypothetical protein
MVGVPDYRWASASAQNVPVVCSLVARASSVRIRRDWFPGGSVDGAGKSHPLSRTARPGLLLTLGICPTAATNAALPRRAQR